jgi:hypothetical protein
VLNLSAEIENVFGEVAEVLRNADPWLGARLAQLEDYIPAELRATSNFHAVALRTVGRAIGLGFVLMVASCKQDTSSQFLWKAMADRHAGPGELTYAGVAVDTLPPSGVLTASELIGVAFSVRLVGSRIVVVDPLSRTGVMEVFDAYTGEELGAFGRRGQGPGEFVNYPAILRGGPGASGDTLVWIFDSAPGQARVMLANLSRKRVLDSTSIYLEKNAAQVRWQTDSTMLASGFDSTVSIRRFGVDGKAKGGTVADTSGWGLLAPSYLIDARESTICSSPDGKRFALAYRWTDRIEIYEGDGTLRGRGATPFGFPAWVDKHPIKRSPMFHKGSPNVRLAYYDCVATDQRIYALFSGRLAKDFRKTMHECWYVHVFDWSGRLERVMRLDHGSASLTVDNGDAVLYTTDVTSEKPSIRVNTLSRTPTTKRPGLPGLK